MGESKELTLIGAWPSPYVTRARIALNVKNLDYHFHEESFGSKSELLLKSNPVYKKVPVLIHNDRPICESLIIVEYIDEVWSSVGHAILPSDPYDRAVARFWCIYADDKLFPSLKGMAFASDEEGKKAALEQVLTGFGLLEKAFSDISNGKPFFGGDNIGILDIQIGSWLRWINLTEIQGGIKLIDPERTPLLAEWAHNFSSDPAVVGVLPEIEKLAEFSKLIAAKMKSGRQA